MQSREHLSKPEQALYDTLDSVFISHKSISLYSWCKVLGVLLNTYKGKYKSLSSINVPVNELLVINGANCKKPLILHLHAPPLNVLKLIYRHFIRTTIRINIQYLGKKVRIECIAGCIKFQRNMLL